MQATAEASEVVEAVAVGVSVVAVAVVALMPTQEAELNELSTLLASKRRLALNAIALRARASKILASTSKTTKTTNRGRENPLETFRQTASSSESNSNKSEECSSSDKAILTSRDKTR